MIEVIFEGVSFRVVELHPSYAVSACGKVLSLERFTKGKTGQRRVPQKILTPFLSGKNMNYLQVVLSCEGTITRKKVHSLVAEAFIGKRPDNHDVDHKDTNTLNNVSTNLRYLPLGKNRGMRRSRIGGAN